MCSLFRSKKGMLLEGWYVSSSFYCLFSLTVPSSLSPSPLPNIFCYVSPLSIVCYARTCERYISFVSIYSRFHGRTTAFQSGSSLGVFFSHSSKLHSYTLLCTFNLSFFSYNWIILFLSETSVAFQVIVLYLSL